MSFTIVTSEQYASEDYTKVLRDHGMILSLSRPGPPRDTARCESFLKTLKREEIHANDYRDLEHLAVRIRFHRKLLQLLSLAFRAWPSISRRVREKVGTWRGQRRIEGSDD